MPSEALKKQLDEGVELCPGVFVTTRSAVAVLEPTIYEHFAAIINVGSSVYVVPPYC